MSVNIEILDERSIGRNYQLVAIGTVINEIDEKIGSSLIKAIETGKTKISLDDYKTLANAITQFLQNYVCPCKDEEKLYPTLYRAGKGDQKILREVGLVDFTCKSLIDYNNSGQLIQRHDERTDLPIILRSYVFSRYRDIAEVEDTNIASLYLALAGVHISLIGRARKGDKLYELYLVPDGSAESIKESRKLYSLLYATGIKERPWSYLRNLTKLEGISFEISTLLSLMLYIYESITYVQKLDLISTYGGVFEKFKLINVVPEYRPLIAWERPLAISRYLTLLETMGTTRILRLLYNCTIDSIGLGEVVSNIEGIASFCISDIFNYFESGSYDVLVHCAGSIVRLLEKLREECQKGSKKACNSLKHYADLVEIMAKLIKKP